MRTNNRVPGDIPPDYQVRDQDDGAVEPMAGGWTESEALRLATEAYTTSTDYIDSNYRKTWETALRYFDGRHAADSKYYKDAYKYRAKGFVPKSRSMSRKIEAQTAAAFFSNPEIATIEALNQDNPRAVATAKLQEKLLEYRLTNSIPTFLTIVGGMQDCSKTGVVCSYNYWEYKTKRAKRVVQQPIIDAATGMPAIDFMGQPMTMEIEEEYDKVVVDKPCIDLQPIENVRFSPNAKWYDPINTSPYLVRMVPMYLSEVRERMIKPDKYGRTWRSYSDGEIMSTVKKEYDSTRQSRLGRRQDPIDSTTEVRDYQIVWAHENFVQRDGEDWVYWTLGTQKLLSDPEPIENVYLHGKRPITMGFCVLETHKTIPSGLISIGAGIQRELNETVNQRRDNVSLVLSKQWFVKAGKQIDTSNLMYSTPGGVTQMQDPATDVVAQEWGDVTSSAYQEQDRFNSDYDELTGHFSAASISTNRRLNETVGGLELLGEGSNALSEYTIRTFVETWLIPTLRQLVLLESYYESDEKILALVGREIEQAYQVGLDEMIDGLIDSECVVKLNVGMNATDPNRKLLRLVLALRQISEISQKPVPGLNAPEAYKEIFSLLGYGNGERFFSGQEWQQQMLQMSQQQAQQIIAEAEQVAKQMLEAAEKKRQEAERAEESAMEEQMQLISKENSLMERFVAHAIRELKFEKDRDMAKMAAGMESKQPARRLPA